MVAKKPQAKPASYAKAAKGKAMPPWVAKAQNSVKTRGVQRKQGRSR